MNTALEMGGSDWSALPVLVRASDRPPRSRRIIELALAMLWSRRQAGSLPPLQRAVRPL